MRKLRISFALMLSLFAVAFISCKDDDNGGSNPPQVEDGIYLAGEATNYADINTALLMTSATNEASSNAARDGMYEIYTTLETGKTFYIAEVAGTTTTKYGPSSVSGAFFSYNPNGKADQPKVNLQMGAYAAGTTTFTVPASGLYHVVIDKQLVKVAIIPVEYWAIIGGATPNGWSDTKMAIDGAFSKTSMSYKVTDLVLRQGDYKFRYSGGWKLQLDDTSTVAGVSTIKVNTNFGGTSLTTLVAGGANISFAKADEGKYTVEAKWTLESGYTFSLTKTGTVDPLPEYPAALYMIGDGLNLADSDGNTTPDGWQWDLTDAPMVPVNSHPYLFWKIVWLEATGNVKFAPEKAWGHDFGKTGDATADTVYTIPATGGDNIPVPGTAGYYMVVVNLKDKLISIADPKVYIGGDCVGGAYSNIAENKFTVDNANAKLTITKTLTAGDIRMWAWHKYFGAAQTPSADWWQEEFIVLNNLIEFRGTGNDQTRVPLTAGSYKIELNFKTGAGSIATVTK